MYCRYQGHNYEQSNLKIQCFPPFVLIMVFCLAMRVPLCFFQKKIIFLTLCSRLYAYLPVLIYLRLTQLTRYCSALLFSFRRRIFNVFFVFVFSSERKRTYRVEPPSPRRREGGGAIWGFVVLTLLFLSCGFPLCHFLALS